MPNPYQRPAKPIFCGAVVDPQPGLFEPSAVYPPLILPPVSAHGRAVAVAVFYAAADWSVLFGSPMELQITCWASLFEMPCYGWLTVDLAERAVHAHFRQSITGHMLPFHVIQGAAVLKLEGVP